LSQGVEMNNANANTPKTEQEKRAIQKNVENAFRDVLHALRIDTEGDPNTRDTARRVAKMYVREVFSGRYDERPKITTFPNTKELDEVYTLGPIDVRSACSHHFVPIVGRLWVGVIPDKTLIGISKFARLARWIMRRPHIQEDAAVMLADELERIIEPRGLALVIKAQHLCMTWRGVEEPNVTMVNSIMRGKFMEDAKSRSEFFDIIKGQGFTR